MDNSEKPICKDCKYFYDDDYNNCHHPSTLEEINSIIHGKYITRTGRAIDMRFNSLKCGPNANFFEYSKWAKLKIKIKEVFTFG